jgi:hypothetical protein
MKTKRVLAVAGVSLGALMSSCGRQVVAPAPRGLPVGELARTAAAPQIGLAGPFPAWAPLPDRGLVTGAELFAPHPPYGGGAVAMIRIEESFDGFTAAYRRTLVQRGYDLQRIPTQFNLVIDRPYAQFEADEAKGGHVIYVTLRGDSAVRYAQLTFYAPPAPRLRSKAP